MRNYEIHKLNIDYFYAFIARVSATMFKTNDVVVLSEAQDSMEMVRNLFKSFFFNDKIILFPWNLHFFDQNLSIYCD